MVNGLSAQSLLDTNGLVSRAVRVSRMAGSPLGLGLAKGLVVLSFLDGETPLVGKDVQPLQSVKIYSNSRVHG